MFATCFMTKSIVKIFIPFLLLIFLSGQLLFQSGCANPLPPEGGFRDTLPPVLLKVTPPDRSLEFGGDRIVFSFDEYVDLENYQQNMIVSPLPNNNPNVTRKLNTVTIKLRDTLKPNTTYSFDFGKSIKDVNEGNALSNFRYVFSTGAYIDSLELTGRVILAETGDKDTTMTVMLYTDQNDSSVIKAKPQYVTKLDGDGAFRFRYLPPGTYSIYALKDEGSYRYLSTKQLFAFGDMPVKPGLQSDSILLYAYVADQTKGTTPATARPARNLEKRLRYTLNLNNNKQDLLDSMVITFDTPLKIFDSTKVHFSTDSTFAAVSGTRWSLDTTSKKLALITTWKENTLYNIILEKDFATDTLGQQLLKADTLSFFTRALSEYGKLTIRFRNLDKFKNPVLQFVQGSDIKMSYPLSGPNFSRPLFEPGEYNLRILIDENQNGKWDPGEFFGKHKQPEIVKPLTRKITVRASWDDAVEIVL
jgi:hypothetical protein